MKKQNPRRGNGTGCFERSIPNENSPESQLQPAIHIKKDGPLFRVQILPPATLGPGIARPESYAGIIAARQAAGWLSSATGLPVSDLTGVRS